MNIHEFQAKSLLNDYGILTTRGVVIRDLAEVSKILEQFSQKSVVKAQIHAGGRGKGHFDRSGAPGVFIASSAQELTSYVAQNLNQRLITSQTGPEGKPVSAMYICEASEIAKEYYLCLYLDREKGAPVFIASDCGGVDIEDVAKKCPEKILEVYIDPLFGPHLFQLRKLGRQLGFRDAVLKQFVDLLQRMYRLFREKDCMQIEINPLALTVNQELIVLDAKMAFDDNALFKHPEVEALRDLSEEDLLSMEASEFGVSCISLGGDIACIVNGAGLAMATMDMITYYGGRPANFLDLGGKAGKDQVRVAIETVQKCPDIRCVFINIFGGIAQCDTIAEGILENLKIDIPVVVRFEGANAAEGRELIEKFSRKIVLESDLEKAVKLVVGV